MLAVGCPRCNLFAFDDASELSGLAYLTVKDRDCSYFVEGEKYICECEHVRSSGSEFSVTENPCPNLKGAIALAWRGSIAAK